ncbi:MAG TPA: ATP-binding cassette domain-containing protein [Pirellulales bacterium]
MSWLELDCRHRYPAGLEIDVAFRAEHQVVGVFGPSGSGKTSLLSMIAGVLRPDEGQIVLAGQPLLDTRRGIALAPAQRRVGMLFQDHLLFPHLSVEGNLRYGLSRRRSTEPPVDFARVVQVLELRELLARPPRSLSGGEKQRVALARALLSGPRALLLDEPLTALDQPLKQRILVYLERVLSQWRIPTLLVSHVAADLRRLAEWTIVIDQGRVVAGGPPAEVLADEIEPEKSWNESR